MGTAPSGSDDTSRADQAPRARHVLSDSPASFDDDLLIEANPSFRARLQRIADDIVSATLTSPTSPGASYGLHGRWGVGKSSAARYLERLLQPGQGPNNQTPTVRTLHMPNLLGHPGRVRAQIGYALVESLEASAVTSLEAAVSGGTTTDLPATVSAPDRQREARHHLFSRMLDDSEAPFVLDTLLREDLGRRGHGPARVLVLDEIDRCTLPQTIELLRAIDYWLRAPLVFFILVCDNRHLISALHEQADPLERTAEEALQKYVHHAVHVPNLLPDRLRLRRYVEGLLDTVDVGDSERALVLDNLGHASGENEIALLDPLFHWNEPLTPRSAKQTLNRLVSEVAEILASGGQPELKRRVISYRWPSFYDAHVAPVVSALTDPSTLTSSTRLSPIIERQADWLEDLAGVGRRAIHQALSDWGRKFAADSTTSLALRQRVDVHELPGELILYLGSGPSIVPPRRSDPSLTSPDSAPIYEHDSNSESGEALVMRHVDPDVAKRDEVAPDFILGLRQAVLSAEIARRQNTPRAALGILRDIATYMDDARLTPQHADVVGQAAVEAELSGDHELAWRLYQRALTLGPDDIATLVNAVDFLVKVPVLTRDHLTAGTEWSARAERLFGGDERLSRLRMVSRFYRKIGRGDDAERLETLILERGLGEPRLEEFRVVASTLDDMGDAERLRDYARAVLPSATTADDANLILRSLADHLSARAVNDASHRSEAVAIYLDLIRSGAGCVTNDAFADLLGNLAILLALTVEESVAAEQLWDEALNRAADDATIRTAYARYLNNKGDVNRAADILRGMVPSSPGPLDLHAVAELMHAEEASGWWARDLDRVTSERAPCVAERT